MYTCILYGSPHDHPDTQVEMTVTSWSRHPTATGFKYGFAALDCKCSCWVNSKNILTDEAYWSYLRPGARIVGDVRVERSQTGVPRFVAANVEILKPEGSENSDEGATDE